MEDSNACSSLLSGEASSEDNGDSWKKTYDTWSDEEQRLLVQLWKENSESLDRFATRKETWQKICDEVNNRFGCLKTPQKCMRKIKYVVERYKDAKEWNDRQSGSYRRKSMFYDEVDSILGRKDAISEGAVQLSHVVQTTGDTNKNDSSLTAPAASDTATATTAGGEREVVQVVRQTATQQQARNCRKKARKRERAAEEEDVEEHDLLKRAFSDLREQRTEMKEFMDAVSKMQHQQMETMNALLGAITQFLQNNSNN